MKKIIYLFAVIGLVLTTACTPLEDINTEIDAQVTPIVGDASFTLTDEDYDALDLSYGNFSSVDDAKTLLPPYLKAMFPVWGKGSSALVGYDLYVGSAPGVRDYTKADDYYFSTSDYSASGSAIKGFYPAVDPSDYLADVLAANIADPVDGQIALAKYVQYIDEPVIISTTNYLAEENFDYGSAAGDITAVTTNWTNHSGSTAAGYATTSLTMADYPSTDIGGSITIDASGSEDVNMEFTPLTTGTAYFSALVNLSTVAGGTYFIHFMNDAFGYSGRVGAKDDGSGKVLFGIGASSSSLTYGTTAFDLNTTYLIVASYDINSGLSNLYVLTTAEATEPATPEATDTGNSGNGIQKIGIRQGSGGPTATIDGVRVATSWEDLMVNDVAVAVEGKKANLKAFYKFNGTSWKVPQGVYLLSAEDFDSMGTSYGEPGYYNNFGSSMPADDYMLKFLNIKFTYALEGTELIVIYDYYSSSSGAQLRGNLYTVVAGEWTGFASVQSTTLQFGHDGNTWVPDNTIKYEFVTADYDYIVATFGSVAGYESAVGNLSSYGNISMFNWTPEQVDAAISAVLLNNFPGLADGQKFNVTIFVYDGSSHDLALNYILSGGVYVRQ